MNEAQLRLYRREWGACRKVLRGLGRDAAQADAERHAIHVRALGRDKSSLELTNAEFDKVLAVFRSYSRADDLDEQLRLIDQPEQRLAGMRERAAKLATDNGIAAHGLEAYLEHLAQQVCARPWLRCGEVEAAKLCGILELQARRVRARAKRAPRRTVCVPGVVEIPHDAGNPF